ISISGVGLLLVARFNAFLMLIAVLTFYVSYTGMRSFRRVASQVNKLDYGAAWTAMLTGLLGIVYGGYNFIRLPELSPGAILILLFGSFVFTIAWNDLNAFKTPEIMTSKWRVQYHITRMGGSFIAAITAFTLVGVRRLTEGWEYDWIMWLIPTILISPIISYYKRFSKWGKGKAKTSK
ncbi:MAG: hypothetical protein AAFQ37_13190, partial [Bacteroidota bacterium]